MCRKTRGQWHYCLRQSPVLLQHSHSIWSSLSFFDWRRWSSVDGFSLTGLLRSCVLCCTTFSTESKPCPTAEPGFLMSRSNLTIFLLIFSCHCRSNTQWEKTVCLTQLTDKTCLVASGKHLKDARQFIISP